MWLGRLLIGVARPSARGRKRRRVGPSSTVIEVIRISSPIRSWLFSAFAAAESISLWMSGAAAGGGEEGGARAGAAGGEGEERAGLLDVQAADLVGDQARLARSDADVFRGRPDHRQLAGIVGATTTRRTRFFLVRFGVGFFGAAARFFGRFLFFVLFAFGRFFVGF